MPVVELVELWTDSRLLVIPTVYFFHFWEKLERLSFSLVMAGSIKLLILLTQTIAKLHMAFCFVSLSEPIAVTASELILTSYVPRSLLDMVHYE